VVQAKKDYEEKMLNILRTEEYICLDSDPTTGVENNVTAIIKKNSLLGNIYTFEPHP
jgi:hypothetical protein